VQPSKVVHSGNILSFVGTQREHLPAKIISCDRMIYIFLKMAAVARQQIIYPFKYLHFTQINEPSVFVSLFDPEILDYK
jgi:hypothetical protein